MASADSTLTPRARRTLRSYLIGLAAVALVPALGVGAGTAYFLYRDLRQTFEARLIDAAETMTHAVERHFETRRIALRTLGNNTSLDQLTDDALARLYRSARRTADDIGDPVVLFLPERVAFRTNEPFGSNPAPVLDVEGVRQAFESKAPVISNLFLEPRVVVPLLVPVIRDGKAVAVLGSRVGLRSITDLLSAALPANIAFISVVDANGRVVASAPEANASAVGQQVRDWQRQAITEKSNGRLAQGSSVRGIPVVAAVQPIPTAPGWTVTVAAPRNTYEALRQRPLFWMILGCVAAFLLSFITASWLAHRLVRPVFLLTQHAKDLAARALQAGLPFEPDVPIPVAEIEMLWLAIVHANAVLRSHLKETEASEARFRAVISSAVDAIIIMDEQGIVRHFNHGAERAFGWTSEEIIGQKINALMPQEHAVQHDSYLSRYYATGERRFIGSVGQVAGKRKDGSLIPLEATVGEWRDAEGRRFFAGILRDITERKRSEEKQGLLIREVDHRAKNLLAVVQSVVKMSRAESTPEFVASVTERINALARAHSLLAHHGWTGADLAAVAELELAAYDGRVKWHGPPVPLAHTAVQPTSMILHELATNAAKHGALSAPNGRVALSWFIDTSNDVLNLRWAEAGGPAISEPKHKGFGTRVVDGTVAQLGGTVRRHWPSSGLICEVQMPMQRIEQQHTV